MNSVDRGRPGPTNGTPRVVVGVDGSADSMRALAWAARETRLMKATLEVAHADFYRREILELFAAGILSEETAILDRAVARARELEPDIVVVGRLCEPPAAQALIATSEGAEMLVVGSRGLSGLKEMTMGSVSNECAHHARCPVVIIRPEPKEESTHSEPIGVPLS